MTEIVAKKSTIVGHRAMTAAFLAAESILGPKRTWHHINAQQERLLTEVFPATMPEADKIREMETIVSWLCEDINRFFDVRGMDVHLDPFQPNSFGIGAYVKLAMEWEAAGEAKEIVGVDGKTYPGARLPKEKTAKGRSLVFRKSKSHDQPLVTILTKSGDLVHVTPFAEDVDGFDLVKRGTEIVKDAAPDYNLNHGGVHFPCIKFDHKPDLKWMLQMWTTLDNGKKATIEQAVQQIKLSMNHQGVIVEDGFAAEVGLESFTPPPGPDFVINSDFLFVYDRGLSQPIVTGILRPDVWQDPGTLDFGAKPAA